MRSLSHHFHKNNEALSRSTSSWGCFCFLCRYLGERGMSFLQNLNLRSQRNMIYFLERRLSKWKKSSEQLARYFEQNRPSTREQDNLRLAALIAYQLPGGGTGSGIQFQQALPPSPPQSHAPVSPGSIFIAALFSFLSTIWEPGTGYFPPNLPSKIPIAFSIATAHTAQLDL